MLWRHLRQPRDDSCSGVYNLGSVRDPVESRAASGLELQYLSGLTSLAIAALLVLGALPARGQAPRVDAVIRAFPSYTDQQIVDIADLFPDVYIMTAVVDLNPVGHPIVSNADCVANPDSVGCRIIDVRALAATQGVVMDKLCITDRSDLVRKRVGWELDVIDGVPFNEEWLLEVPGPELNHQWGRWRNGIVFQDWIDIDWVHEHEPSCCHDGTSNACLPSQQCVAQYGWGDDVAQHFVNTAVGADLRIDAYQQWSAERLIALIADTGADCVIIGNKPGWWTHYGGPDSGDECWQPGVDQWKGPTRTFDPCARNGGLFSPTPYGPGEYEAALNGYFRKLFAELDAAGLADFPVLTIERPAALNIAWSWIEPDVSANPHLIGEFRNFDPFPDPNPPPTLTVYLLPPPRDGTAPHDVDLSADTRGNAQGPIDYHLWCDCANSTEDLATALAVCGSDPDQYHAVLATSEDPLLLTDACHYEGVGTYIPKVLVEREGAADEDRIALNVEPRPVPMLSPSMLRILIVAVAGFALLALTRSSAAGR